jgi:hypothetical protein
MPTTGKVIDNHIQVSNVPVETLREFKIKCLREEVLMRDRIGDLMQWAMDSRPKELAPLIARAHGLTKDPEQKYTIWFVQNIPQLLKYNFKLWQRVPMAKAVVALAQLHLEGEICSTPTLSMPRSTSQRRRPIAVVTLTDEQAKIIAQATDAIEVRDPMGAKIGTISPDSTKVSAIDLWTFARESRN